MKRNLCPQRLTWTLNDEREVLVINAYRWLGRLFGIQVTSMPRATRATRRARARRVQRLEAHLRRGMR